MRYFHIGSLAIGLAFALALEPAKAKAEAVPSQELESAAPEYRIALLRRLIDGVLEQTPELLAQNIALVKAEAYRIQSRTLYYPSIGSGSRFAVEQVSTANVTADPQKGFFYTLSLNQSLYRWGETQASAEIGALELKIAQKRYAEVYREVLNQVRTQFFRLCIQRRGLQLRQNQLVLQERALEELKERVARGQATGGDIDFSTLGLEEARLAFDREHLVFETGLRAFQVLTGDKTLKAEDLPGDLPEPTLPVEQAQRWKAFAEESGHLSGTPTSEVYRSLIRQAELRYAIAKVRLYPKVDLSLNTSLDNQTYLSANSVQQDATRRHSAAVVVNWTLFDGFATRAAKMGALAEKRQAQHQYEVQERALAEQRRVALEHLSHAMRALAHTDRRLVFARGTLGYYEQEAKSGRASPTQLESAQNGYASAELAVMASRADVLLRWSDLLGQLWLDPSLSKLSPSHFKHVP